MVNAHKYSGVVSFVLFTLLPLVCTSVLTFYLFQNQGLFTHFTVGQWSLFSIVLTILCALAICPPTFLAIVMGFFLGWVAFIPLIIINLAAILLIYIMVRILDFSWVENYLQRNPKINKVLIQIKKEELKFIFFTKLSPLFPFALTNLIFAVSGASLKNIVLGGFLGMIPRTLLAVYVGTEARELQYLIENPNEGTLSQIIIMGLILISVAGMYLILKKAVKV